MKNILNEPGIFWFEDDEENKFNGTIIEKDNHYLLKTDIETEYFEKYFKKNIIIGQINETRITLYENHLWNPFKTLTFSIGYIFKNYNYESNLNFKGVTLKFYNLEEWIGIDKTFEKKFEENGYKIIPKFEPFTFKQNRFEIIFALGSSLKFTKTSFCAESNYMIQIFYNSAAHIKTILGDIKLLKRFLTFLMYNKTEIKSMDCTIDNEFRLFNKIDVYSKSFNENIEYINPFNITVKFDEIENKQEIFNKWFEINEKYKPLFDIYFMNFTTDSNPEYEFLSYAQALESYLRKNEEYVDYYMDSEEYEDIKNELNDFIETLIKNDSHKNSLINKIKFGNEISLRKRLKDLINDLRNYEIVNKIIDGNKNEFIDEVVDARNYYTHYDDSSNFKKDTEKLLILNFKLKLLIELIILKELEFKKEAIDEKLEIKYEYMPIL